MKMKKLSPIWGVLLCFLLTSFTLQSAVPKDAKYKRKRLYADPYLSTRSLGRGNTYITTATDEDAILLNPALVPQPKGIYYRSYILSLSAVGALSIFDTLGDVDRLLNVVNGGVSDKAKGLTDTFEDLLDFVEKWEKNAVSSFASVFLGTSFKYVGFGVLGSVGMDLDSGLETVNSRKENMRVNMLVNIGPYLTGTLPIPKFEDLKVGLTFKYLVRGEVSLKAKKSLFDLIRLQKDPPGAKDLLAWDHKPGFDVGIVYTPKLFLNPRFGLLFSNIGHLNYESELTNDGFVMEPIRQNLGFGASIHPRLGPGVLSASLDIRDITASYDSSFLSELYLGVDYLMWEMLGFAVGLGQGYPSASIYFTSRYGQIDVGIYSRERELRVGQKPETSIFLKLAASI